MSTSVGSESEASAAGKHSDPAVVQVTRPVAASVGHVWEVLVSPVGSEALLGEGAVLRGKGEPYHCSDGTFGVVRSYHPLEQLRVSWHADDQAPATIVELDLRAEGGSTVLDLRHHGMADPAVSGAYVSRWDAALAQLASRAESTG
jgi:hypothetical protein